MATQGDMFGSTGTVAGIFKGTGVKLILGTGDGSSNALVGALVQTIALTYTRDVTRVWELGSDNTYYIVGHTAGQMQMDRIVAKAGEDILDMLSDVCTSASTSLTLSNTEVDCSPAGGASFSLQIGGPVVTQRGFSMAANQFVVNSNAALMFSSLTNAAS
jgi:hypothetical protein